MKRRARELITKRILRIRRRIRRETGSRGKKAKRSKEGIDRIDIRFVMIKGMNINIDSSVGRSS